MAFLARRGATDSRYNGRFVATKRMLLELVVGATAATAATAATVRNVLVR